MKDRLDSRGHVMDHVDLKHCYGIKALKHELDFEKARTHAFAIYAPMGS